MRYLALVGTFAAFLISAGYAVKAEWIRDYLLNHAARTYGATSSLLRMQKWFVGNPFYVISFRIVSAIVAACLLGVMVYLVYTGS